MKKSKYIIVIILILAFTVVFVACTSFNERTYTVTIIDHERITYNQKSKYLIYCRTDDGETKVFENTDNWFRLKFNSSDFYADLEVGKTYTVTVVGYRVAIFNGYENIIRYEEGVWK